MTSHKMRFCLLSSMWPGGLLFLLTSAVMFLTSITEVSGEACPEGASQVITGTCDWENIAVGKPTGQSSTYHYGTYGDLDSSRAVDGDTSQNPLRSCSITNVHSVDPAWWYVDLGHPHSVKYVVIYRRNDYASDNSQRFDGFRLYVGNSPDTSFGTLCYMDDKDGKSPSVFRTTCDIKGRYVIVINSEMSAPKDTSPVLELCEVEVYVCSSASYGDYCQHRCGHCKEGNCDPDTGICINGCTKGWIGDLCKTDDEECVHERNDCHEDALCTNTEGSYTCSCPVGFSGGGINCKDIDECLGSPCHTNGICNNTHGNYTCDCAAGWIGDGHTCTICKEGLYGYQCNRICGHCAGNDVCHHVNGSCANGCLTGRAGQDCITEVTDVGGTVPVTVAIAVGVVAAIIIITLVIIIIILWRRIRTISGLKRQDNTYVNQAAVSLPDTAAAPCDYTDLTEYNREDLDGQFYEPVHHSSIDYKLSQHNVTGPRTDKHATGSQSPKTET